MDVRWMFAGFQAHVQEIPRGVAWRGRWRLAGSEIEIAEAFDRHDNAIISTNFHHSIIQHCLHFQMRLK